MLLIKECANDVVTLMFSHPKSRTPAAAVLETTIINTAVYAQQYVRYKKNETIAAAAAEAAEAAAAAAAAAAEAAAARSSSNSKPSNLGNK